MAPAGVMGFDLANRRSRIANLGGLAVIPGFAAAGSPTTRGRPPAPSLSTSTTTGSSSRSTGFNERAIEHAERSGFIREGVKRKAYWRHGEWVDGVFFGLVREDLD